jgi:hypothetical protein
MEAQMDELEWVARCSARLHAQWPRIGRPDRDEVARQLFDDERWRAKEPEEAALEWVRQGSPNAA